MEKKFRVRKMTEGNGSVAIWQVDGDIKPEDINEAVYAAMCEVGQDVLDQSKCLLSGERTAAELAGRAVEDLDTFKVSVGIPVFDIQETMAPEVRINVGLVGVGYKQYRPMFTCSFAADAVFEQIAEWEGQMSMTPKRYHRFRCEAVDSRKLESKNYVRCHGYHPTAISYKATHDRINKKFETIGRMVQSLSSEGMRKALSLLTAVESVKKLYGHEMADAADRLMRRWHWERFPRQQVVYQTLVGGRLVEKRYPEIVDPTPVVFTAKDFEYGPECYKTVDKDYALHLLCRFKGFMRENAAPSWIRKDDFVQMKNQQTAPKKWQGRLKVCRVFGQLDTCGRRIDWYAEVSTTNGKWDSMNRTVDSLEALTEPEKPAKKKGARKSQKSQRVKAKASAEPKTETKAETLSLEERLRQALLTRLAA